MVYHTLERWNELGYTVKKGEHGQISAGHKIVFSRDQVKPTRRYRIDDYEDLDYLYDDN
jgi:superfamily I DNA and RNA helicase